MSSRVTMASPQEPASRQEEVLRMAMSFQKMVEEGVKNESTLQKALERERKERQELEQLLLQERQEREELEKVLLQERQERAEMEEEHNNEMDHFDAIVTDQSSKIVQMDDTCKREHKRIIDLTELLTRASVGMGANRDVVKSDSDPVTRLETELNRFCRMINGQRVNVIKMFQAVTQIEVHTRVNPDSESGQAKERRPSVIIPIRNCDDLQPEPSTSAASNVTREPPKKRKIESTSPSPVGSDVVVKEEPVELDHRRNSSIEFRGKYVCTCLQKFDKECQLRAHIHYYLPEEDLMCPFSTGGMECEKGFPSTVQLTQHIRLWHGVTATFRRCGYCRALIKMGDGRLKKHHLDVHNIELTDDDGDDDEDGELTSDAPDEMNNQQSNDLVTGDIEGNNEVQSSEEDVLFLDDNEAE